MTIHKEQKEQAELAFNYAEDGALHSAARIFEDISNAYIRRAIKFASPHSVKLPSGFFNCCENGKEPDWQEFVNLEIRPCQFYGGDIEQCAPDEADIWTIYGRLKSGLLQALHDTYSEEQAKTILHIYKRLKPQTVYYFVWKDDSGIGGNIYPTKQERDDAFKLSIDLEWERLAKDTPKPECYDRAYEILQDNHGLYHKYIRHQKTLNFGEKNDDRNS